MESFACACSSSEPVAGHVAQPQDRAPADGAALHVDEAAAEAARGQAEGLAPLLSACSRARSTAAASAGPSQVPKASAR